MRNESGVDVTAPTPEETRNERAMAIVRLVVSVVTIVNIVAAQFGWEPLGVDADQLYMVVSSALAIAASLWAWWKNNNMTLAAIAGQRTTDAYRARHLAEGGE